MTRLQFIASMLFGWVWPGSVKPKTKWSIVESIETSPDGTPGVIILYKGVTVAHLSPHEYKDGTEFVVVFLQEPCIGSHVELQKWGWTRLGETTINSKFSPNKTNWNGALPK